MNPAIKIGRNGPGLADALSRPSTVPPQRPPAPPQLQEAPGTQLKVASETIDLYDSDELVNSWSQWFEGQPRENAVSKMVQWLKLLTIPNQVIELRALKVSSWEGDRTSTFAGYFDADHLEEMIHTAMQLTGEAEGVYFTLNPLNPDLLARCCNRAQRVTGSGSLATDNDVLTRQWLIVDLDPVRISGVSSTDEEKERAHDLATQIERQLQEEGWPTPVLADSGNGYHLLYRIELPRDDDTLLQRALVGLAKRFDTEQVKVDTNVFNPARIIKLYGTMARKGDHIFTRPHRWTGIVKIPDRLEIVSEGLLQSVAQTKNGEKSLPGIQKPNAVPALAGTGGARSSVLGRAEAYLQQIPPAISGQGGHKQTFKAACRLIQGFALSVDEALPLLEGWNARCEPPWTRSELLHKLEDAAKGPGERGYFLAGTNQDANPQVAADTLVDETPVLEEDDDPHRLARLYLESRGSSQDLPHLRYWRDEWLQWDGAAYRAKEEAELSAELNGYIKHELDQCYRQKATELTAINTAGFAAQKKVPAVPKVTVSLVTNVLAALKSLTLLKGNVESPTWLKDASRHPASEMLAFQNGIVHLPSFASGSSEVYPSTPAFFSTMALEYDVIQEAKQPTQWLSFLQQLWPQDQESIDSLAEWFGYCLLPDTSQQKILMLVGPPRSGKGTISRILTRLIGKSNVAGPTLAGLSTNFGLSALLGKQLGTISDARLSGKSDQAVIVERLLSISGEDSLTIDRKNREPLTVTLPTRLMLVSNELPRLNDASGALTSRLIILRLTQSFFGKEDPRLLSKLETELPGIFHWTVQGLHRLRQRGHFHEPASSKALHEEMTYLTSPIQAFISEECEVAQQGCPKSVDTKELFQRWVSWCENCGIKSPGTSATFGRDLRAAVPSIERSQVRTGPVRSWSYLGISLRKRASGYGTP